MIEYSSPKQRTMCFKVRYMAAELKAGSYDEAADLSDETGFAEWVVVHDDASSIADTGTGASRCQGDHERPRPMANAQAQVDQGKE